MNHRVGTIRNIRTIKALRGDPLSIDLGISLDGDLRAWMKREANSNSYREFDIVENRYLTLSREKTSDYYSGDQISEEILGKWYFDVEYLKSGELESSRKTIYTGAIVFYNDITGSNGIQSLTFQELFDIEGGNSRSVYSEGQTVDLGNSNF